MSQLQHWTEVAEKVTAVEQFLDWLENTYDLGFDFHMADEGTPLDTRRLIDKFFEVDRAKLEIERRELLDAHIDKTT